MKKGADGPMPPSRLNTEVKVFFKDQSSLHFILLFTELIYSFLNKYSIFHSANVIKDVPYVYVCTYTCMYVLVLPNKYQSKQLIYMLHKN